MGTRVTQTARIIAATGANPSTARVTQLARVIFATIAPPIVGPVILTAPVSARPVRAFRKVGTPVRAA